MQIFMSNRLSWLASSLVAASALLANGAAFADPLLTDQDQYPRDFPATYPQVQNKILDMTSDPNSPHAYGDTTFRDQWIARQATAFRAINREMMDLQTLGSPTIRTRDLPSAYCSSLLSDGFNSCAISEEPVPDVPTIRFESPSPMPSVPIPALW
jgi:hypothetical protein